MTTQGLPEDHFENLFSKVTAFIKDDSTGLIGEALNSGDRADNRGILGKRASERNGKKLAWIANSPISLNLRLCAITRSMVHSGEGFG